MELLNSLHYRYRKSVKTAEEGYRLILLRLIIMPLSRTATRAVALKVTELFSAVLVLMDAAFHRSRQCRDFSNVFSLGKLRALALTWKYVALPFTDFAFNNRFIYGIDKPKDLKFKETNIAGIDQLRRDGKSYIVATGHFTRKAYMAMALKELNGGVLIQTTLPANPATGNRIYDQRVELQFGANLRAASALRPDIVLANVGTDHNLVRTLCKQLREGQTALLISIDAPWDDNHQKAHERAFAGFENKRFSTGVLTLARLSGCPIVPLVCHVDSSSQAVLEWGEPFYITKSDSEEAQVKALDGMLDQIERAIGLRPEQYLLPIGNSRKWDNDKKEWESATLIS